MADALSYAQHRTAFGKPILDHSLLRRQSENRLNALRSAFALAWDSVQLLNDVWMERPPYSDRYHLFRLVAHPAKYWTAEFAVDTAKWAMEVHGGLGVLAEYGAERWYREAMILAIWEGTSHRQILDGLEVMERKQAHKMLEGTSGHGIGSRAALEVSTERKRRARRTALQKTCGPSG
jgi:alkylation response protein AidB-like acyl-CoA dehydrogenase